jgi:hypothetical protein
MPFTQNFTTSQTVGLPSYINLADTSTGTPSGTIASRRVYFITSNNTYLVQEGTTTDYEVWAYSASSASFNVLDKDYALNVKVQWLDAFGVVLYEKTILAGYSLYNESFDYQMTQMLTGNPLLINDNDFFNYKSELRVSIDSGNQAISFASDIYSAQQAYDNGTRLRVNSQYYFNTNS